MTAAKKGDKVKVHYTGTFENGNVFDSSEKRGQPLEVEVGAGMLIKGFDDALVGMEPGQVKEITVKPEEGYGMPNPQLVRDFPRSQFPEEQEIHEGMMVAMHAPDGQQFPATITKVGADSVTVDVNHPLAGKTLKFKIILVSIEN